ncbi:MAG TPA: alpha/beta fold hydrolase [Solirubrobacteraceae bacterium]|jgi:pimeloyl-ACP methyl ester carboxylesterase|nr:alpha/beta fold hydrolase [Solirubrobacteraceae bacterium]
MPAVTVAGLDLAYAEHGEGPATVLVHGMASSAADWADAGALPGRVIAYDRRGYGASTAPEPYTRTTVNEQAEDLARLLTALDAAPALLVGADFGALVVLDVLLRHSGAARAAVLIDPPLHQFTPEATEALSAERLALEEALREGGPEEAVARWLGDCAGAERVERARRDARAFFADYGGLATLPLARADLRGLAVPIGVVGRGEPVLRLVPHARAFADWREAAGALA